MNERPSRSPLLFFALAFALSVPFYLLGALVGEIPPVDVSASALMLPIPLVAALILVRRSEGPGGARRFLRRVLVLRGLREHRI